MPTQSTPTSPKARRQKEGKIYTDIRTPTLAWIHLRRAYNKLNACAAKSKVVAGEASEAVLQGLRQSEKIYRRAHSAYMDGDYDLAQRLARNCRSLSEVVEIVADGQIENVLNLPKATNRFNVPVEIPDISAEVSQLGLKQIYSQLLHNPTMEVLTKKRAQEISKALNQASKVLSEKIETH